MLSCFNKYYKKIKAKLNAYYFYCIGKNGVQMSLNKKIFLISLLLVTIFIHHCILWGHGCWPISYLPRIIPAKAYQVCYEALWIAFSGLIDYRQEKTLFICCFLFYRDNIITIHYLLVWKILFTLNSSGQFRSLFESSDFFINRCRLAWKSIVKKLLCPKIFPLRVTYVTRFQLLTLCVFINSNFTSDTTWINTFYQSFAEMLFWLSEIQLTK